MTASVSPQGQHLLDALSRREWLTRTGAGFAGLALGALLAEDRANAAPTSGPHFAPKARAVIQLFQHGGPSHMDLFDPKPELNKRNGKPMPKYFTDLVKISSHGNLLGTPFKFRPAGKCGVEYSEIVPHTATDPTHTWDSDTLRPHARARILAPAVGTYAYVCRVHPSMHGTLIVLAR